MFNNLTYLNKIKKIFGNYGTKNGMLPGRKVASLKRLSLVVNGMSESNIISFSAATSQKIKISDLMNLSFSKGGVYIGVCADSNALISLILNSFYLFYKENIQTYNQFESNRKQLEECFSQDKLHEGQASVSVTQKSGHLAWCALAALALARQDGTVCSAAQENLFLTRWLATVLKQSRFSREVAPDIEWLLKQRRQYGVSAKLAGKLDYLWRSCTGELSQQNDLFRLTYALEMAKDMCWTYRLLSDREWVGRHAAVLNAGVNGIYLSRASLDAAFDDDGQQITPVMARLTGRVQGLETLLNRCGWKMAVSGPSELYKLIAEKTDETATKERSA